ncbi:hypothetical protein [Bacteroides heparinolyticus]|uniref:hypothetical protein n=1 Tax=Prevotella heparinolytica TaxID=28113 RepID=UPI00359F8538
MKKMISKAVCIKNITVFSFVTLTCVLVLSVFVVQLMEDLEEGVELFIPGISALFVSKVQIKKKYPEWIFLFYGADEGT